MATYIYIGLLIAGVGIAIFGNLSLRRLHQIDQSYFSVKHEIIRLSGDEVIRFIDRIRVRISILAKPFILDGVLIGALSGLKILNIFPNFYTTGYLPLISVLMIALPAMSFIKGFPSFSAIELPEIYSDMIQISIHEPERLEIGTKSNGYYSLLYAKI